MNPDFSALLEKVRQLAEVTHALRRDNAELRASLSSLAAEHQQLTSRMGEAHDRIAALLETMPADSRQEAA